MASRASQPNYTQAPYRAWHRPSNDGGLQADEVLTSDGSADVLERREAPRVARPSREAIYFDAWPGRDEFRANYAQWLEDSLLDSLPDRMRRHESYRAIVAQGDRVVPLIASALRTRPSFLFLALEEIMGVDPVPDAARGNLRATIASWLSWLRR